MHDVLGALGWVSALVGVTLVLTGLIVVIGQKGSGVVTRAFRSPKNAGWFSVKFGLSLILFNVAAALTSHHGWSVVTTLAAVVILAASMQNRPFQDAR